MTKRTLLAGLAGLLVAACGGGDNDPDAGGGDDSPPTADARIDAMQQPTCSFTEANDTGNDMATGAEASGQTLGATAFTLCGTTRAMAPVENLIDNDTFQFTVGAAGNALVRLSADLAGQQVIMGIDVLDAEGNFVQQGLYIGGHAVLSTPTLDPGMYVVEVFAVGQAAPSAPIPWEVSIITDVWDTRCAPLSGAATFTEAGDGANNTGNDMVNVNYAANPAITITSAPGDNPEASAIVAAAGMSYKVEGQMAVRAGADSYLDKDTFQFRTGPTTNQVDIHLRWPGTDSDVDMFLFTTPAGTPPNVISLTNSLLVSNEAPEFVSTAVLPDTDYWLWIGHYEDPANTAAKQYGATVCATQVTP